MDLSIYDGFVEGFLKSKQYFNINVNKINAKWPVSGSFYRDGDDNWLYGEVIKIRQDARWEWDVILHEFGHDLDH